MSQIGNLHLCFYLEYSEEEFLLCDKLFSYHTSEIFQGILSDEKVVRIMDENNIEDKNYSISNIENEDSMFDLSAIMRLATNLLQEDSVKKSALELGQFIQTPIFENWMDTELILLTKEEMQKMVNELNEVKKELAEALAISESLKRDLDDERAKNQGEQQ